MKRRRLIFGAAFILILIAGGIVADFCFQHRQPRARWAATAIVLSDGQVLLAGGYCAAHPLLLISSLPSWLKTWLTDHGWASSFLFSEVNQAVTDCDLFDPKTETWSATGSLYEADAEMVLIPLKNGALFGLGAQGVAQIWERGRWKKIKGFDILNGPQVCAPLSSGKILCLGAQGCQLYEPESGTWRDTSTFDPVAVTRIELLKNGRILAVDEQDGPVKLYDPVAATWTTGAELPVGRICFECALLPDGRVLICGGMDRNGKILSAVAAYNPQLDKWSNLSPMPVALFTCTAVNLSDGRVLIAGGVQPDPSRTGNNKYSLTCSLYDPKADRWSTTGSLHDPQGGFAMALLPDGRVLAVGDSGVTELYDPDKGTWRVVH